jgi:hypothetical protein
VSDCSQWNAQNSSYDIPDFGKPNAMWHDCPLFGKEQECVVGPASFTKVSTQQVADDHGVLILLRFIFASSVVFTS